MNQAVIAVSFCTALFILMSLLAFLGHRIGRRRVQEGGAGHEGTSAITGAIFALLGLLIAFMFAGALDRLDRRRQLILDEANAILTAWRQLDFLSESAQPALRVAFRSYTSTRAGAYDSLRDPDGGRAAIDRSEALQDEIWRMAVRASTGSEQDALLMDSLCQMFQESVARTVAGRTHAHPIIFITLFVVALACALLAGYSSAERKTMSRLHTIGFSAVTAFTVFIILDIEYPRDGLVNLDRNNAMLHELVEKMN